MAPRPVFVLHDHRKPRPHFDLRLEEDGVLRSWAVPRGLPTTARQNRLAIAVPDHDLDHVDYTDEHKSIADTGWWQEESRDDRRIVFVLHGRDGARRYALIRHRRGLAAPPHQGAAGGGVPGGAPGSERSVGSATDRREADVLRELGVPRGWRSAARG